MNPQEMPQNIISAPVQSKPSLKLLIVAALILTIGGIGFGTFGIVSSKSANKEIIELKNTIAQQKDELERFTNGDVKTEEEITENENGETIKTIIKTVTEKSSSDYIYIGEWGIKVKIPGDLAVSGYSKGLNSLCINGISISDTHTKTYPEFSLINKNADGLGCINRESDISTIETAAAQVVYSYEDENTNHKFYLVYSHPQAVYSIEKDEQDWEIESTRIVQNMLTDKNNFEQF